jgi:ABC-2 type transport system permease protein
MIGQLAALLRVSLMTAMQYRSDFVVDALTGLLRTSSMVVPLLLVYQHVDAVADWSLPEATLVLGLFMFLSGFFGAFMEPNLGWTVEAVRQGTLDLVLLKPLDSQVLCSVGRVAPARVWDIGASFLVGGWALAQMPTPSMLDVVLSLALVLLGFVALYGVWILAICTSFWFVRVDNLRFLIWSASDAARWPVTVFTGWIRWLLTFVLPVALVSTYPALALRGQWTWETVATALFVSVLFGVGSRLAWNQAIGHFTSASSGSKGRRGDPR